MKTAKPIAFDILKAKPFVPPFIEIVQYWDGLCYANVRPVPSKELPEYVTYAKLKDEIRNKLDIELPEHKDLIFTGGERKKFAYVTYVY